MNPSIRDPLCVYLEYFRDKKHNWGLSLKPPSRKRKNDILLIFDVSYDHDFDDMPSYLYCIVSRGSLKECYRDADTNDYRISSEIPLCDDAVLKLFETEYPDFELCSPGFSDYEICINWWKRKMSGKANKPTIWKDHVMLDLWVA